MEIVQHEFFDSIVPYIVSITVFEKEITVRIPYNMRIDDKTVLQYFDINTTLNFTRNSPTVLKGKLKDRKVFDYLFNKCFYGNEKENSETCCTN